MATSSCLFNCPYQGVYSTSGLVTMPYVFLLKVGISKDFDKMYSQKAFVHWFKGERMEESEFEEARVNLGWLEKDYLDVLCEQATDEDDEDSDDE